MSLVPPAAILVLAGLAITSCSAGGDKADAANPASPRETWPKPARPVLVELYQSQGCSSCPPADANLNAIVDAPNVVALSFAVTYWDRLGWKDTYAKPEFTRRQWDYAHANHRANVATPQVWIDGQKTVIGNRRDELVAAIDAAHTSGPSLSLKAGSALISAARAPSGGADIWLARFDPATRYVAISAGENDRRTLAHRNIVHSLTRIGHWSGAAQRVALPPAQEGLQSAVFLQAGRGGPVVAVARD
jgi:hypothetical protein